MIKYQLVVKLTGQILKEQGERFYQEEIDRLEQKYGQPIEMRKVKK